MEESILTSIKKLLNLSEEHTSFDTDIIMHINTVFNILNQLGIGSEGFRIEDDLATWSSFLKDDVSELGSVKTYVYLKVKLMFDPPLNSSILESTKQLIAELEWRINVYIENKNN